ncbi:long-chain fatty acid--CoA ligase [Streptomyces sp. DSM 110735]|uniref:long-chain-fatty-acid--CoA ligase n=1 Tax=Streptomyces sp. DSM 110735 TaxID=2775031 RepID=UPI0018F77895|nr:long-chain fatty acid--CoA ligase [Streptomyces sp. DSM 110735]MBJ7902248.1 long-chain fatty acid--CoA ligase [Streptomyces sp. DSM 110735]
MNLAAQVTVSAQVHPDRTALRIGDRTVSYRSLDDLSARAADFLRESGLRPGDRVGIMLPNTPEFAICYFGALRAGGVVVPMNPLLKSREVAYYLGDSGTRLLFAWHDVADEARAGAGQTGAEVVVLGSDGLDEVFASRNASADDVVDRGEGDTAVLLYTSGTTGRPKGAELTHANLTRNRDIVATELLRLAPADVIFGGLPLFHAFGQTCTLNAAVASGACLTLLPRFDARRALEILSGHQVTVVAGVPTIFGRLLEQPDLDTFDDSLLRLALSGGAALPPQVQHDFREAFDCVVLEGYGLSETSPVASFNTLRSGPRPGSVGTPITGVEMRVIGHDGEELPRGEIGEIAIRGHNVMKGYWQRPEETAEAIRDGWFHTGDLARVDQDGYFWIVGRNKDLIIRGGYNVYPRELESVLYGHPAVADAAVVGLPDPDLGQEVGAAVVLKPGARATADELRAYVKDRVAAYKYPRKVWITDALPKGPTGKILKREIVPPTGAGAGAGAGAGG